ncbi:MAG TPA: M23 family metallopeptidase, partial [Fibrella sp.]
MAALFSHLLSSQFSYAQTPDSGFGPGSTATQQSCLSPDEHQAVAQYVQTKIRLLNFNSRQKPTAHPMFRWPLEMAKPTAIFTPYILVNFVDHSPTLGPSDINQYSIYNMDYQCGRRTYNQKSGYRHAGTDISLYPFDWETMSAEVVSVVAAAPGTIISKQDGYDDQSCGSFATGGQWNAVYVRHDDGSVAWYGHLKRGSLTTKRAGERVTEGEFLGYIGSSGRSSGPHLHFEVYDASNKLIDPFAGACNKTTAESWWKQQPDYAGKGINRSSLHLTQPVQFACPPSANKANEVAFVRPGQLVYFYTYGWNMVVGDSLRFDLIAPTGQAVNIMRSKATNSYNSFYWWQSATLTAAATTGTWTFRVTFGQQRFDHPFVVTQNPATALTITSANTALRCPGDSVRLTASVTSKALLWRRNGVLLNSPLPGQLMAKDSGTYTVELAGVLSAPLTLTATIIPLVKPAITQNGLELTSNLPGDNQWLRNDVSINGATGQTITVRESGRYRVQNRQICGAVLSDALEVLVLATESPDQQVTVSPNPATHQCEVR